MIRKNTWAKTKGTNTSDATANVQDKANKLWKEVEAIKKGDRRAISRANTRNGYMRAYAADLLERIINGGILDAIARDDLQKIVKRLREGVADADLLRDLGY